MTRTTTEITSRDRLLNAISGEPIDRVPVWLMRQAGRYLPQYQAIRKNYDFLDLCKTPEAAAEASIQPIDAIDTDAVIIFNDIMLPLEAAGAEVKFGEGGPKILNPVRSSSDLAALKTRSITSSEPITETIKIVRDRVGPDFPILGFIGAPWTLAAYWIEGVMNRNFDSTLAMRWSEPHLLDEILERITEVASEYLRIQIEAGADAVQIFDTWGTALRNVDYERFSGRWIRKIIASISHLKTPVIVYVNGCAPYLESLKTLGADCLSIDWRIDLASVRAKVGPKMALQGNIDPLVLYSTPDAIDGAVKDIFDRFPPATGHVFNLGHGVLPKTPVENAQALIKAVKKYGACK